MTKPKLAMLSISLALLAGCTSAVAKQGHSDEKAPADARRSWTVNEGNDPVIFQVQPERPAEEVEKARREIPPVKYDAPADRWSLLPVSRDVLDHKRAAWRVVMLGDSIVNDSWRSRFGDRVQAQLPRTTLELTAVVGGGKGCWWYEQNHRVERFVEPLKPDLLIVGGISHKNDIEAVRRVIRAVRAAKDCDVLLLTGPFGPLDPVSDEAWHKERADAPDAWHVRLAALAREQKAAFLDLQLVWGNYLRGSGKKTDWFHRDEYHANARGEAVLGEILAKYLSPPE